MRLDRMTWPQVATYFSSEDTVMMLFGSTEQHGRHNPLGTDTFAPMRISELIEEQVPDLLITPILPFGSTNRFMDFPGTFSLGDQLLFDVVTSLTDDLYAHGARHFIFLNGHGGNTKALTEVQMGLSRRGCRCALLDWWAMIRDIKPEWAGGHGGAQETSAMLYIDPALVDLDAVGGMGLVDDVDPAMPTVNFVNVTYKGVNVQMPRPTCMYATNGWIGPDDPARATAEWGHDMLHAMADWAADFIRAFRQTALPDPID